MFMKKNSFILILGFLIFAQSSYAMNNLNLNPRDGGTGTSGAEETTDTVEPTSTGSPAGDQILGGFVDEYGESIKEGYDECVKKPNSSKRICEKEANNKCSGQGEACRNFVEGLYANDGNLNGDINQIMSDMENSDYIRKSIGGIEELNCFKAYAMEVEGHKYLNPSILEIVNIENISNSISVYETISQCGDPLGLKFIGEGEVSIIRPSLICRTLLSNKYVIDELKQAGVREDLVGAKSCFAAAGDNLTMDESMQQGKDDYEKHCLDQRLNYYKTSENTVKQSENGETTESANYDLAIKNDAQALKQMETCKAEVLAKRSQLNKGKKFNEECGENDGLYKRVRDIIGKKSDSFKKRATKLLAGCVALKEVSEAVLATDIDDNEESYHSIDSKIKCVAQRRPGYGPYALDYGACKTAAYWYNGTFLTNNMVAPVVMNAVENSDNIEIQNNVQNEMMLGGEDANTAALRAQRKTYKHKANRENISAGLEAGKAMAMFGNMMNFPTPDLVSADWCQSSSQNNLNLDRDVACSLVYMAKKNRKIKQDLFANQKTKEFMLGVGAEALSKAVVHAIVAGTYKKQAKFVGMVEDALENAESNQPENQLDLSDNYCAKNPTVPSCKGMGSGGGYNTGVDMNFDGITPQTAGSADFGENGGEDYSSSSSDGKPTSEVATSDLSDIMGEGSDNKFNSKDFKQIGAAGIKAAGTGGGSSGGGGGGSGGGGGGGSGGGDPKKAGAGGQRDFGKKITGNYATGGTGQFSSGGKISKKRKSNNPFANLGGRGSSRKIASKVEKQLLPKKSKLFEVISKRYADVHKKGVRLQKVDPNFQ